MGAFSLVLQKLCGTDLAPDSRGTADWQQWIKVHLRKACGPPSNKLLVSTAELLWAAAVELEAEGFREVTGCCTWACLALSIGRPLAFFSRRLDSSSATSSPLVLNVIPGLIQQGERLWHEHLAYCEQVPASVFYLQLTFSFPG